jgi:hypothetical protein
VIAVRGAALLLAGIAPACGPGGGRPPADPGPRLERLVAEPGVVVFRACTPAGAEACFDARDDNCNGVIDEGCGLRTGLVQFVIAWDRPAADVDLLVTDPNGELVDAPPEAGGAGRAVESGLVKERDCPGESTACHGQNLENVYLESGEPLRGAYRVRVRLEKLGGENPPIRVTFGARVGPRTYQMELDLVRAEEEKEIVIEL